MAKKKLKFKKRRKLDRRELFKNKVAKEDLYFDWMYKKLKSIFPNKKDRSAYINALIQGMEQEPNLEHLL